MNTAEPRPFPLRAAAAGQLPRLILFFERRPRRALVGIICGIVLLVSVVDYFTGYELTFSFFYLGAIALAAWFIGWRFALGISFASVVVSFVGDLLAGAGKENFFPAVWNAALALGFYAVTVGILTALRSLQSRLEERVRERTAALTEEMGKRELLEKELLAVAEGEQRRIGHDLHDTLCQHLTATAIAGEVLREKLTQKSQPEAADANRVVSLLEEGISLARNLARGLAPVELEAEGLMAAFHDLARTTTERFPIECRFECPDPVLVHDSTTAGHLFRIAQEAVTNAIKHGRASQAIITLASEPARLRLRISDDGSGTPLPIPPSRGMGMHIMRHRAQMIGADFEIRRGTPHGMVVDCILRKEDEPLP